MAAKKAAGERASKAATTNANKRASKRKSASTRVDAIAAYLEALPEPRRSEMKRLDALIRSAAPDLAPSIGASMIGYGPYRYRYASGREGDSFKIALSSRANGISVYVCAVEDGAYVAERAAKQLGKVSVGKSCVRFKKVDDLALDAFVALLKKAAAIPAMGEVRR